MFERRLKVFLLILGAMICLLIGRAAQVQIIDRDFWQKQATSAMRRTYLVETTRGAIKDRMGRILAIDKPCTDVCIEYPALTRPPEPQWVQQKAADRLKNRLGDAYLHLPLKQRRSLRDQETQAVVADIDNMWGELARVSSKSADEIQEIREAIIRRVQTRQRYIWQKRLEEAMRRAGGTDDDGGPIKRFLANGEESSPDDSFVVSEQKEAHVFLRAVDTPTQNELLKDTDRYPGLVLRPGSHREYPYMDVACHLLGNLTRVNGDEVHRTAKVDELVRYWPNDLIGRSGIEALCEPALHGLRGRVDRVLGEETILGRTEPTPGRDVQLSIDIELQQQIQVAFGHATLRDAGGKIEEKDVLLHGAAVVLDVKTNQVLALVSYPTYDLNSLDENYTRLHDDIYNEPLRNRATLSQLEPGSTVKPLCGLAGIAAGVIGVNTGIECKGFLYLDGHKMPNGRCWIASMYANNPLVPSIEHHLIPFPHQGHDGNLDGHLTFSDGLERSCNVFFETTADLLGIERLSEWYERFGLGRPTGIGIAEASGRLPRSLPLKYRGIRRSTGFFAGIGQGFIATTPIQMANAAAMIARDGIWMRPQLLMPASDGKLPEVKENAWRGTPEKVDLHLPPEALAAAKDGMWRVVNGQSGTGKALAAADSQMLSAMICGKTGTAQASPFSIPKRDKVTGKFILNEHGQVARDYPKPSEPGDPNPDMPWYRLGKDGKLDHAWYIGFAPRDNPTVAFAVMVEYGGSGGVAAAAVAREALEAAIARSYLHLPPPQQPKQDAVQQVRAE